jgi:hypothetical protein
MESGMAKKPPKPERSARRPKEPRVTLTATGLHALIYFVDRLGHPDEIGPGNLVLVWFEAGAILILIPDHERCALRGDHDDTFFELFGWCAYHRVEVDVLSPEEFDEDADQDEQVESKIQAATFTQLSPEDVAAFQDVVQGRGGVCMSDRKFHAKGGPEENPEGWPDTGILVVYQSVSEGSASQRSDADLTPRNATLYARNEEWLRTTVEALRTLVESYGPGGQKMQ